MAGFTDFLTGNAGSIIGGLLGAAGGGSSTTQATQSRDPWGPAQPYILGNLQKEASLQDYYAKTPFNAQQQQGYSNLFGDNQNFRDNIAPGLMNFANQGMTQGYQRATGGPVGSGGGYGGARVPGGMTQGGAGPFSVNRGAVSGQNSLLDLNGAQNPYSNGAIIPPKTAAANPAAGGASGGLLGGNYGHDGSTNTNASGGIGIGNYTDAINQTAMDAAQKYGMMNPMAGLVAGLISKGMSESQALAAVNSMADPIAALNALQGWTTVDPSYGLYGGGNSGGDYGGSNVGRDGSEGGYGGDSSHGTAGW